MAVFDLIIIGAGPAGMIAASRAAERGASVVILEAGPSAGRKLLLTGGGRCNLTNTAPLDEYLKAFGRQGGFLRAALTAFSPDAVRAWFARHGIETVVEGGGRVFPATHSAADVRRALLANLSKMSVELLCHRRVTAIETQSSRVAGVRTLDTVFEGRNALIATGGLSYPQTGSQGDGYLLAAQAGHTSVEPYGLLVGLETLEDWPRGLQGVSLPDVEASIVLGGRRIASSRGEMLFTHFGVSGPAIMDLTFRAGRRLTTAGLTLVLDFIPNMDERTLENELMAFAHTKGTSTVASFAAKYLPRSVAEGVVTAVGVETKLQPNHMRVAQRKAVVRALKSLTLEIARPRPIEEAIVTGGGVPLKEIDAKTMRSRLVEGLYFAGEVIDLAGPSGGFNLQMAWSTGYMAGESI